MWFFDDLPFGGSGWLQRKAFICVRATTERLHPSIIKHHGHRKIGIWGVMPIDLAWIQRSLLQGRWKKTFSSVQKIVFKNKLSLTELWFWNKSPWIKWNLCFNIWVVYTAGTFRSLQVNFHGLRPEDIAELWVVVWFRWMIGTLPILYTRHLRSMLILFWWNGCENV